MADQSQGYPGQSGWQPQPPGQGLPSWQPPQQPGAPGAPAGGPQPKETTPLSPPQIWYNTKWRVAPLCVKTQEEADALDPTEWTQETGAAPAAASAEKPPADEYPQLYFNVNVVPKVVGSAGDAAALGGDWQQFQFTDALLKAAQTNLQNKQKADAAKAAAKAAKAQPQAPGQYPPQYPPQYPQYGYPPQQTGD